MDDFLECIYCTTKNRKNGNAKKKSKLPSINKEDHPKTMDCCFVGCVTMDKPFEEIKYIARLKDRYFYFCEEECYANWLDSPNSFWL